MKTLGLLFVGTAALSVLGFGGQLSLEPKPRAAPVPAPVVAVEQVQQEEAARQVGGLQFVSQSYSVVVHYVGVDATGLKSIVVDLTHVISALAARNGGTILWVMGTVPVVGGPSPFPLVQWNSYTLFGGVILSVTPV